MQYLEKYFGVKLSKKLSLSKILNRTDSQKAKHQADITLREVNSLFVQGHYEQCFDLLQKAVKLVPNDSRPFYLLGLIHEEMKNYEKAHTCFFICALLKKNDTGLWKKVLKLAPFTDDSFREVTALERICRREPTEELIKRKLKCYERMNKKYHQIVCKIELFDYYMVDENIFDQFEKKQHNETIKMICSRLMKCIKNNTSARTEVFLRRTITNLYKIKEWKNILFLFDEYYSKIQDNLSPEMKLIYIISKVSIKDNLSPKISKKLTNLLKDDFILKTQQTQYIYDLSEILFKNEQVDLAVFLLEKIFQLKNEIRALIKIGDLQMKEGKFELALDCYNRALEIDPMDLELKSKLYNIYSKMGNSELAFKYSTATRVFLHTSGSQSNKLSRYSSDKCFKMREIFDECCKIMSIDMPRFIDLTAFLMEDFFNNSYATAKRKRESISNNQGIVPRIQENLLNSQTFEDTIPKCLLSIYSLHGLTIEEWFFILKSRLTSLAELQRFEEVQNTLTKLFDMHLFYDGDYMMQLYYLGITIGLAANNFDFIVEVIKRMCIRYNYSATSLLNFLCNFFPSFYKNSSFAFHQKNVQRIARQDYGLKDVGIRYIDLKPSAENKQSLHNDSEKNEVIRNLDHHNLIKRISILEALSSFLPRYLFTQTVDYIAALKRDDMPETSIFIASIYLSHSKSRTLINKFEYAKKGIDLLKQVVINDDIKMYNLGRAYHFYGYYNLAEDCYFKLFDSSNEELKKMAIFNLSLIFKKTKSKQIQMHILKKINTKKELNNS